MASQPPFQARQPPFSQPTGMVGIPRPPQASNVSNGTGQLTGSSRFPPPGLPSYAPVTSTPTNTQWNGPPIPGQGSGFNPNPQHFPAQYNQAQFSQPAYGQSGTTSQPPAPMLGTQRPPVTSPTSSGT